MKINWGFIKFFIVTALIVFLFGFSNQRNKNRKISRVKLDFKEDSRFFITPDSVNKLLIQNYDTIASIDKETLDLNMLESRLSNNEMIKNAEVYLTIDGVLGAKIEQRNPIARVLGSPDFYLDEDAKIMPLSLVYTARVPLVTGDSITSFIAIKDLLLEIEKDDFMKEYVIGLDVLSNEDITLKLRKKDFKVLFGKVTRVKKKFKKFKAFYKLTKDSLLSDYSLVNLKFNNQVVATKR